MKTTLVSALCACVGEARRAAARRFLQGLSADELQYIADFYGACILEAAAGAGSTCGGLAAEFASLERCRCSAARPGGATEGLNDREHKIVLLFEYLSRCGAGQLSPVLRTTGRAG